MHMPAPDLSPTQPPCAIHGPHRSAPTAPCAECTAPMALVRCRRTRPEASPGLGSPWKCAPRRHPLLLVVWLWPPDPPPESCRACPPRCCLAASLALREAQGSSVQVELLLACSVLERGHGAVCVLMGAVGERFGCMADVKAAFERKAVERTQGARKCQAH